MNSDPIPFRGPSFRGLQVLKPSTSLEKRHIFLLESNRGLLEYLNATLSLQYHLHAFQDPETLLLAMGRAKHIHLLVYAWNSAPHSLLPLQRAQEMHPSVPILILCCSPEKLHPGALSRSSRHVLLLKPFTIDQLQRAIAELLPKPNAAATESDTKEIVLDSTHSFVRASKAMHDVERQASLVARSDIPVLILGESGTGKEILAIFLHSQSKRKQRTFMKINCAAMPAELLESELFGYEQGAFTGANRAKPGKFEVCDGGTIFLDEIGEMPASLQAKLLQVLQDGTFSRLGSRSSMRADVRVLSATNIAMKKAIASGLFREDLYYRLNGISIRLPPLRERKEEIPALIRHFVQKGSKRFGLDPVTVSPELQAAMLQYNWPGNLRELENLINRLLALRSEASVLSELEEIVIPGTSTDESTNSQSTASSDDLDPARIMSALEENRWNRRATADALNITYRALLYKIKLYGLASKTA